MFPSQGGREDFWRLLCWPQLPPVPKAGGRGEACRGLLRAGLEEGACEPERRPVMGGDMGKPPARLGKAGGE